MATAADLTLGVVYSFNTYVTSILGSFENVKVEGIIGYEDAVKYIDPATQHANVFPSLPAASCPDDFTKYYYLVVKFSNGSKTAIGLPWIDATSIIAQSSTTLTITVDNASIADADKIRLILSTNGYRSVSVAVQ